MDKFTLTKTIEARKLNPRTKVPTGEPPVTIPFGAIIQDLIEDRDIVKFSYLGEPYQCLAEVLQVAMAPIQPARKEAGAAAAPPETPASAAKLQWQLLQSSHGEILRAKVPGGWLILAAGGGGALAFYPDPDHRWDGASLP
jgi:hypothetical protein